MSRRASLPGADELFRAKPLVSVPDVAAIADAAMPIEATKPAKKISNHLFICFILTKITLNYI